MMSIEWAKPVVTELLVLRMSRPFAAKPAANRVRKSVFTRCLLGVDTCYGLILGLILGGFYSKTAEKGGLT